MKECIYVAKESQQRTLKHCIDMIVDMEAKYPIEVVRIAKVKTPHVAFTNESITSVSGICSSQKTKLMPGEFVAFAVGMQKAIRSFPGVALVRYLPQCVTDHLEEYYEDGNEEDAMKMINCEEKNV